MNIYHNPNVHRIAKVGPTEQNSPARRVRPLHETDAPSRSDSVNFSSEGKMLNAVWQELAQVPDIRVEKVNALKKAIAEGTYRVSSEKIAEAMLREGRQPRN